MLILISLLLSFQAHASIGSTLGFTSRATALGGAMVASGMDSASAYQNPGSLAARSSSRTAPSLQTHWGVIFLAPEFTPIGPVVLENEYTSDVDPTTQAANLPQGSADTEYPDILGQSLGLSYQSKSTALHWSFGFVTFLPLDNLALVDSGETYVPEYVLHRSRHQRPVFDLAVGIRPTSHWSIGAGMHVGTAMNANTTAFLQTGANKVSTMRITAGLKTKLSPFVGTEVKVLPAWTLGGVLRLPLAQRQQLKVNAAGSFLGGLGAPNVIYDSTAVMFYDPLSVELGSAVRLSAHQSLYLQADFQAWSKFESPNIEIESSSGSIVIAGSNLPVYPLRDIIIPRVGYEWSPTADWSIRLGYSYRPSIYEAPPEGAGNLLDPSQHRVGFGIGKTFSQFLDFDTPCRLDLHASYHALVTETVVKTPGTELGTGTGQRKIGAPGYQAGGHLWGGGLSLAVML